MRALESYSFDARSGTWTSGHRPEPALRDALTLFPSDHCGLVGVIQWQGAAQGRDRAAIRNCP